MSEDATPNEPKNPLTEQEQKIISIEKRRWKYQGAKEQAVRSELGMSAVAYYQQLNRLIDNPRVIEQEPALMRRLREHRDSEV